MQLQRLTAQSQAALLVLINLAEPMLAAASLVCLTSIFLISVSSVSFPLTVIGLSGVCCGNFCRHSCLNSFTDSQSAVQSAADAPMPRRSLTEIVSTSRPLLSTTARPDTLLETIVLNAARALSVSFTSFS